MKIEPEILVHVTRGSLVECSHRGSIAVVGRNGRLLASAGDPQRLVFARSAAKPLQAAAVVASGAAARFQLNAKELAVLCASHNGEPEHVENVLAVLAKLGLPMEALRCGAHPPTHKPAAEALIRAGEPFLAVHNNCSGKHSGMLALAMHLGADPDGYTRADHPVQQAMLAAFARFAGVPQSSVALGTDGCGVPTFGVPLTALALAFARFGSPSGDDDLAHAARIIADAIRAHPHMIAGTGRFDSDLIRATRGRILGKMGADGVFAAAVPGLGIGLAVKIEDGARRALFPAVVEALVQLDALSPGEAEALAGHHFPRVRNWSGDTVGGISPVFRLSR